MTHTDAEVAALMARFTPKQRAKLERGARFPGKWLMSPRRWFELFDQYEAALHKHIEDKAVARQRSYMEMINRVTTYTGPDYRVRAHGQDSWIRATKLQYDQAALLGMQRSIGMPDLTEIPVREIAVA